ncbi:MAG: hydroxymethylglutaryl-CoA lyase [Sterolibacteriaceae bacterium]|uniref:hydroxymethylglutaryl-CoA lyase n=1 Tax=Candidatus Methylophosphatis roskildensis TaxID=2899263 RepID=A0A9D7HQC3_9PROT|nr:hydroxymethylglutaryl-CoA lyase [Candidatus Methylophosphatis roskildensis]
MADRMPARVRIVEVGPRDGLQNEPGTIDVATKLALIERLAGAGLAAIEAAAFVSPRWVPQMAGSGEVMRGIRRKPGVVYSALTPNMQGFGAALAAGCDEVAVFAAASETFSRKNINCSIAVSIDRFRPVVEAAREHGMRCRGYISCALGCPYEGAVDPQVVARLAAALYDMGCYEISLGDTIGVGTPSSTLRAFDACARVVPVDRLAGHFHDTWGMAIANIHAALGLGVGTYDASVGGLGGCPYSPGASGNVATENVVYLLHGLGIETGVDLDALVDCAAFICGALGRSPQSKVARARLAQRAREGGKS